MRCQYFADWKMELDQHWICKSNEKQTVEASFWTRVDVIMGLFSVHSDCLSSTFSLAHHLQCADCCQDYGSARNLSAGILDQPTDLKQAFDTLLFFLGRKNRKLCSRCVFIRGGRDRDRKTESYFPFWTGVGDIDGKIKSFCNDRQADMSFGFLTSRRQMLKNCRLQDEILTEM